MHVPTVPRSLLSKWLRTGQIRINGCRAKLSTRLAEGDRVRLPPMHEPTVEPQAPPPPLSARALYEDDDVLVIDKPSGLSVHAGSGVRAGLIERIRATPGQERFELAHRLDRDTSGCLLVGKKPSMVRALHALIRERKVGRRYMALAHGSLPQSQGVIDEPLLRLTDTSGRTVVNPAGRPAKTRFRVTQRMTRPSASVLDVSIETGRTHQIRVHLSHIGHPIIGDTFYGGDRMRALTSPALHAYRLSFPHPRTQAQMDVYSPIPDELRRAVAVNWPDDEIR